MDFNLKCVLFLSLLTLGWIALLFISKSLESDFTIFAIAMLSFKLLEALLKITEEKEK